MDQVCMDFGGSGGGRLFACIRRAFIGLGTDGGHPHIWSMDLFRYLDCTSMGGQRSASVAIGKGHFCCVAVVRADAFPTRIQPVQTIREHVGIGRHSLFCRHHFYPDYVASGCLIFDGMDL